MPREQLFDQALLWALTGLTLARRKAQGPADGAHLGTRGGTGEDFFQHRAYVTGEDLRAVDFRASARAGHLLVKELHRPMRQPLVVAIDSSASMSLFGKLRVACQLGASAALLALRRGDPVSVLDLAGTSATLVGRLLAPAHPTLALEQVFGSFEARGAGLLLDALVAPLPVTLSGSNLLIISDLYADPTHAHTRLGQLVSRAQAVTVLHVLAPDERALPAGLRALRDVETGEETLVSPALRAEFSNRVREWQAGLRQALEGRGEWVDVDAARPVALTLRGWLA